MPVSLCGQGEECVSGIDLTRWGISIDHLSGRVGEREGVGRAMEAKRVKKVYISEREFYFQETFY